MDYAGEGERTQRAGSVSDGQRFPSLTLPARSILCMMERTRRPARRKITMNEKSLNRRKFLGSAAAMSLSAASYANIPGSNDRLRVGFIGCGGRAQAHIDTINRFAALPLAA